MGGLEERLEILLDRNPADIELHRPFELRHRRMRSKAGTEIGEIHAASPMVHMRTARARSAIRGSTASRRGSPALGRVEPPDVAPDPFGRHARARRNIIRELRMIGRGERHFVAGGTSAAPRRTTALRWRDGSRSAPNSSIIAPTLATRVSAEADLGIGRARAANRRDPARSPRPCAPAASQHPADRLRACGPLHSPGAPRRRSRLAIRTGLDPAAAVTQPPV